MAATHIEHGGAAGEPGQAVEGEMGLVIDEPSADRTRESPGVHRRRRLDVGILTQPARPDGHRW